MSSLAAVSDLIVNFTPTGMIPTQKMTPHVPVQPEEIIEEVRLASEIGISMVHLHARDPRTGEPTWKPEVYAEIIEGIRANDPELILCVSTSGRTFNEFEKRAAPIFLTGDAKPDMASLTLSSLNFNAIASVNSPDMIRDLAQAMLDNGVKPEFEAFDAGMINYAKYLIKKDLVKPPHYFNLLLGNIACAQADMLHAGIMVRDLPQDSYWSFAGIGSYQLRMNMLAIASGGGVRVGLEDNIWYDYGRSHLASNKDLLQRIHNIAKYNSRQLMPPVELRKRLGLQPGHGAYGLQSN